MRTRDGDGYDRFFHRNRQMKRPLLERQEPSVSRTRAFDEDHHADSGSEHLLGFAQTLNCTFTVAAINRNEGSDVHRLPQHRYAEQLFFYQNGSAPRYQWYEQWRIKVGGVVGHEDVSAVRVQFVAANYLHLDASDTHSGPRDPHGDAVNRDDLAREERVWKH